LDGVFDILRTVDLLLFYFRPIWLKIYLMFAGNVIHFHIWLLRVSRHPQKTDTPTIKTTKKIGTHTVVLKSSNLYPCSFCGQKSSIDWIQKYLQAKGTAFHQVLNQLGTLTDIISNWNMIFVPQPVLSFKTCKINGA
jgi:hypothetical protein